MIFLATNKRDITTDFVVLELQRRNIPFFRLNSEDMGDAEVIFRPGDHCGWHLRFAGRECGLSNVQAAYYRRPGPPQASSIVAGDAARAYCAEEWSAVLRSLWNALEDRWLNSPFAILRAEDKPRQLSLAKSLGFNVPETLITNDFTQAERFTAAGGVIGKPLRHALIERDEIGEVLFSSRFDPLGAEDRDSVSMAPIILQREVKKRCDVRVTVVGAKVFAAAIHSQDHEETEVDWRKGSRPDLRHEALDLPRELKELCIQLTRQLDLSFGAIDLILDEDGAFWFLEINPNGQWAWIERRTGLPIAAALVDLLTGSEH